MPRLHSPHPTLSLSELEARNAEIRRMRALPIAERPSLQELADQHGISRERVSQIASGRNVDARSGLLRVTAAADVVVELEREGEGRFMAYYRPRGTSKGRICIGAITGGRSKWTAHLPRNQYVHGSSLPDVSRKSLAILRA